MTAPSARAFAPGRCTVVGEHVDYADGVVVCMAVHLGVEVTLSPGGEVGASPYVAATLQALRERGVAVPPVHARIEATLPAGAGLSSSAALCCATAAAALRMAGARLSAAALCDVALHAERDILGVPCGPLDQRAVVLAPAGGAQVLDCADGTTAAVPWPAGHVLVACHTGDAHDVGGEGYRARRAQADATLHALGARSWREATPAQVDALADPLLRRRARHIVSETRRALDCAEALRHGDAARAGALMSASHNSLRDDCEVSTPALDAAVAAAQATPGCLGARLCGAGFGGTAIALCPESAAAAVLHAMQASVSAQNPGAWLLRPSPGLAALNPDLVAEDPPPELLEGIRLFNDTRWFEAHEVLERAWLADATPLRQLHQGILQIGVGLHHARNGNLRGALNLLDRGMSLLAPFEPTRLGVDVTRLVRDAATTRRALAAPGGLDAYDWSNPPRVHMAPER